MSMLPAEVNLSEPEEGLAPRNIEVAARLALQLHRLPFMLLFFMVGLHPVCSLLQLQFATLAHTAFGKFVDAFLTDETPVEPGKVADKMGGAMAIHYVNAPKTRKSSVQVQAGRRLSMRGDHVTWSLTWQLRNVSTADQSALDVYGQSPLLLSNAQG